MPALNRRRLSDELIADRRREARLEDGLVPGLSEAAFQAAVIDLAEWCGWSIYHAAQVRGRLRSHTSVGYPDLTLVHPHHGVVWAELKTTRGRLTAAQTAWLERLRSAGARHVFVWRPADWPAIVRLLRAGGWEP